MKTFEVSHVNIKGKEMVRELASKAVLNTDMEAYHSYLDRVTQMQKSLTFEDRINNLESQLDRIEKLLIKVLGE